MNGLSLRWASEEFELLPERALFWQGENALVLADIHLGKPAAFRAWGIPVPDGTTQAALAIIDRLVMRTGARRLLVLGDLVHARAGRQPETMRAVDDWRAINHSLEVILIRGNHDHSAGDPPRSWNVECHDGPLNVRNLALVHDPVTAPKRAAFLAGHIHPVISIHDDDGTSLRLPCFCFGVRRGLLPAFGAFTGGGRFEVEPGDRIFLASDGHVAEAPPRLLHAE